MKSTRRCGLNRRSKRASSDDSTASTSRSGSRGTILLGDLRAAIGAVEQPSLLHVEVYTGERYLASSADARDGGRETVAAPSGRGRCQERGGSECGAGVWTSGTSGKPPGGSRSRRVVARS